MPKSPQTPEFRMKVSQEYLDGLGSDNLIYINIMSLWKKDGAFIT